MIVFAVLLALLSGTLHLSGAETGQFTATSAPGGFFIEAEHYDFEGGKSLPEVDQGPYSGGAYRNRRAIHGIDYFQMDERPDIGLTLYRNAETPNVPMYLLMTGPLSLQRGSFTLEENFGIAWAEEGDWFNYTRTFTNGNYHVYAAQSHGDGAGTPNRLRLRFGVVSGSGDQQSVQFFGAYQAPATGEYGLNALNQVMNGPVPAVVHLSGRQTIRVYHDEGDFDWFLLVPTTDAVTPVNFVVEAEDFDSGGGQSVPQASIMPLTSDLYRGRGAVAGVDYQASAVSGPDDYREGETPNVRLIENFAGGMNVRGSFNLQSNYRIWTEPGEWFNYTRTFPRTNYHIFAAISHADTGPTSGSLHLVAAGRGTLNQRLVKVGDFKRAGGTGGWGANRFVPLEDALGNRVSAAFSGTHTVRFTAGSGDFDYLVFVPASAPATFDAAEPSAEPISLSISRLPDGQMVIQWTGDGTLEGADAVHPAHSWESLGSSGRVTVAPTGRSRFFRVRR